MLSSLNTIKVYQHTISSDYLQRNVIIDVYVPAELKSFEQAPLLLINDGQDLPKMPFDVLINDLIADKFIEPIFCVGIYCGEERKREYGTAYCANYKGDGDRADLYTRFIFDELLPFIRKQYQTPSFKEKVFAGFSLGGLSALDIVWNYPHEFKAVGIFSGSLWWRRKNYDEDYDEEKDRLMHSQILKGNFFPWLKFFFECGTLDEIDDRNNNGIIDSIDDTLDLIVALRAKGYTNQHIKYLEIENGTHDVKTWAKAFPDFLRWIWGVQS